MQGKITRRMLGAAAATTGALIAMPKVFAQTPESVDDGARIVEAANGDIEVLGTPERVIAMEYELVEHLQTVDVVPVGISERDSVNVWLDLPVKYGDDVVDIGLRDEPDLEAILLLDPDLIIAASPRQDQVIEQLEDVAPTVQLETYSPRSTPTGSETSIDHAKGVLRNVAIATNTEDVAEQRIAEFDEYLTEAAARVEELGYAGREYIYGSIIVSQDGTISLFTNLSRIAGTITALGLVNHITLEDSPDSHFAAVSLEHLGTLPEDVLFIFSVSDGAIEEIEETLASSLWESIPFVQAGNVINLGTPNIWTAGGLITMTQVIDRVTGALAERE